MASKIQDEFRSAMKAELADYRQTVKLHGTSYKTPATNPAEWPTETLLWLFKYGLKQKLDDCVRSGTTTAAAKAALSTDAAKIKHMSTAIIKVLDDAAAGTLETRVPEDIKIAVGLVKKAGYAIDARNVTSWTTLEKWHKTHKAPTGKKRVSLAKLHKAVEAEEKERAASRARLAKNTIS
jgi:hypothetical protein